MRVNVTPSDCSTRDRVPDRAVPGMSILLPDLHMTIHSETCSISTQLLFQAALLHRLTGQRTLIC